MGDIVITFPNVTLVVRPLPDPGRIKWLLAPSPSTRPAVAAGQSRAVGCAFEREIGAFVCRFGNLGND
jgi:hypothetical protein